MKNRILTTILLVLCLMGLSAGPVGAQEGGYTLIDMGTLGCLESYPFDFNDLGQVVGESCVDAFLWDSETGMQDLSQTLGISGQVIYINNQGQVVGNNPTFLWSPSDGYIKLTNTGSYPGGMNNLGQVVGKLDVIENGEVQQTHAFLWSKDTGIQDLGTLAGNTGYTDANAIGINDHGQVVGWSNMPTTAEGSHAFRWTPETGMQDLGIIADPNNEELFINNNGEIAGSRYIDGSHRRGFVWTPEKGVIDLGTLSSLPDSESRVKGFNDQGQVIGSSDTISGYAHAFLWIPEKGMQDLGTLGGNYSSALDINNLGQIVGRSNLPSGESHAFLWTEKDGMIDLGTLEGGDSAAYEINNSGQIMGISDKFFYGAEYGRAVLWQPPTNDMEIEIGNTFMSGYDLSSGSVLTESYASIQNGPVKVSSPVGFKLFTSERVISGNSFNEVMGYPTNQLTTEYWFPFYDNVSMTTWVLVGNASSTQTAKVDIYIGGVKRGSYTIPIGGRITPRFNLQTGPVRVVSTNGVKIFTSERAVYKGAFNEVMGYPVSQLTTEYWFPWYDNVGMAAWILVGNPSTTSAASVNIYIGGVKMGTYSIPKGGRITPRFNIQPSGPVRVVSTNGVKIFSSERSLYGDSFNEVMGYPSNQLTTEYWYPWYDNVSMYTWVLVGNPSTTSSANVDIYIGGVKQNSYIIKAGKQINQRYTGANTGPVRVVSRNGVKIFTSERVLYGTSFNEVMGYPGDKLSTEYWFPWYDSTSMSTDLLVGRPMRTN
jgi:probable HAF family extracellular repeat protein